MKKKIVIAAIVLLLIIGGIVWYYKFREKSPEEKEKDVIAVLLAKQKELNKEVEAANAGKTITETGGRFGAYRTSTSMTKEEWNQQLSNQISNYQNIINEYLKTRKVLEEQANQFLAKYGITVSMNMEGFINVQRQIEGINLYIKSANESITNLKSKML